MQKKYNSFGRGVMMAKQQKNAKLLKRLGNIFLVFGLLVPMVPYSSVSAEGEAATVEPTTTIQSVSPEVDTFVFDGAKTTNYSKDGKLLAGRGRESFLRFNLSEVTSPEEIVKVTLKLYKVDSNTNVDAITKVNNDQWDANITYNTKPAVDGEKITEFTAAGKNTFIEVELTETVKAELEGDKKLSLHINRISGSEFANEFVSSRGTDPNQKVALIIESMSSEERVSADKATLEEINGINVTKDINLPKTGKWGSGITWTSDNDKIISNDGKVTRPAVEEEKITVNLTATLKHGKVTDSKEVKITVLKRQPISPYIHESLVRLIEFTEITANEAKIGTTPGEYPQEAKSAFLEKIEQAKEAAKGNEDGYSFAVTSLMDAGKLFFSSVVTSNKVIDEEKKKLEYSEYRKELVQLVWLAKAALLVEPEMYTAAAKVALEDEISHAEKVLSDKYEVPFVRNREFITPREDENIQFAIEHYSKAPSYGMSTYGLKPALQWYKTQDILYKAYKTITIAPVADTFVHNGSAGANFGKNATAIVSNGRIMFFKFDLSQVTGHIKKANLEISNYKNDNNTLIAHFIHDDSWTETGITYNNQPSLGSVIGTWLMGGKNNRSTVNVTDSAIQEQNKENILTLAVTQDANARFPGEIYTKEHADTTKHPSLVVSTDSIDTERLGELYSKVTDLANDLLKNANAGNEVGQFPQETIDELNANLKAMEALKSSKDVYKLGSALVDVYDSMRNMRDKQILRTDADPESSLFFTKEGLAELREKIEKNPTLKAEFTKLKEMSDEMTLEDIKGLSGILEKNPDLDTLNDKYKMWTSVINQNFTPPASAVSASIKVVLPSIENEEEGLGHVWVDNLRIYSSTGGDLKIDNRSFETGTTSPDHWTAAAVKGNPIMKWEDRKNYTEAGNKSIYIENPTPSDEGSWEYEKDIIIEGGKAHTLTYSVKNDDIFKEGINVVLTFKDVNGVKVGEYINKNNHKSSFGPSNFNLTFQTDALAYAITGDKVYAEKAKERMLWFLNDHLQGVESWLVENQRPYGIDAYGAVQEGRNAASLASAYSLIKDADVFSDEEYNLFHQQLDYLLGDLLDIRDRTELGDFGAQLNTGNWETDMAAGSAMIALALGDNLPNSRQWLDNGSLIVEGQLKHTLREDGGWPESIRYHFSAMERVSGFAKALRNVTGINWFKDSVLKDMFSYLVEVQTPEYEYLDNHISTPNFGDHILDNGTQYSSLGLYFNEFISSDPILAAKAYQTWDRAGNPLKNYWGEAIVMENFFMPTEEEKPNDVSLNLKSTDALSPWGMFLFRNHFDQMNETYLAQVTNEKAIGHGHYDQGSFILYANKVPLVMDPGIESYFDTSKSWYVSSSAHSTVQFNVGGSFRDTPLTSNQEEFYTSKSLDYSRVKIAHPSGEEKGTQTRHISYVKDGIEAFVIWDQIKNSQDKTRFNLPVASTSTNINGNKLESTGHFGMDLETTVLQPANAQIDQEFARTHPSSIPAVNGLHQLNYLRINAEQGENFLSVLFPKQKGAEGLSNEKLVVDSEHVQAYRIKDKKGKWMIVAVNNSETDQTVTLPAGENLLDLKAATKYAVKGDSVQVVLKANGIHVFKPISIESMKLSLDDFISSGNVDGSLVNILQNNLAQAEHQWQKHNTRMAAKHIDDFIKHLNNAAQSKNVSHEAKEFLLENANLLLDLLSN
jgi:hypothetical protein